MTSYFIVWITLLYEEQRFFAASCFPPFFIMDKYGTRFGIYLSQILKLRPRIKRIPLTLSSLARAVQDDMVVQDDGSAIPFPVEVKGWGWVLMIIPCGLPQHVMLNLFQHLLQYRS